MPTILLEQIIELLTGWKDSFFTWANAIGDKIASIKTNTDSLPDIKDNTDDIKDNTAAVITPISNINTNVSSISSDVGSIKVDTIVIKNNASSIATSSGTTAAFAEDIANNTLEVKNKITTIASDTTQMRADSGAIRSDVSEIKDTLGLYLYNTIVTEDAEGFIANFDTDLKDYLQNAVVTIPADAGGIAGFNLIHCGANLWDEEWEVGQYDSNGVKINTPSANASIRSKNFIPVPKNTTLYIFVPYSSYVTGFVVANYYDENKNFISKENLRSKDAIIATNNASYITFFVSALYGTTYNNNISLKAVNDITYYAYNGTIKQITFGSSITDGASVDLLSGVVTINTSPVTYDSITPLAIRTFKGANNIYSDIGDIDVTYRETLKHYLEKQNNNSRSLNRNVNLLRENIEASDDDSDRRI